MMSESEREFLDQITDKIKALRGEYEKREDQMRHSRNMWRTIAAVVLAAAITLGATNITLIANHDVRIETLETTSRSHVTWDIYLDYTEFMNLKFKAFEAIYNGTFPEKYPEFSQQLENLEKIIIQRRTGTTRSGKSTSIKRNGTVQQ